MKFNFEWVKCMRITVNIGGSKITEKVSNADQAAEFFAMHRSFEWWRTKGCLAPGGDERYQRIHSHYAKLYRRSKRVFDKLFEEKK